MKLTTNELNKLSFLMQDIIDTQNLLIKQKHCLRSRHIQRLAQTYYKKIDEELKKVNI